jgi:aspartate aminotransferase
VETQADNDYKITAQQLKEAISTQTKLLILNSPSNPTGSVYTPEELRSLAEVVLDHNLFVVSDEIYEKILYAGATHLSIAAVAQEMLSRTAVSGGLSKSHAMTGWRLGYIAAPVEIIKDMITIQSHSTSGVCTFAQYGGIAALEGSQDCVDQMLQEYTRRRKYALEMIATIPQVSCPSPLGAFYLFLDISQSGLSSVEFANALLKEQKVVVVPGAAYGDDNCIRLAYSTNFDSLKNGLTRLARFIDSV